MKIEHDMTQKLLILHTDDLPTNDRHRIVGVTDQSFCHTLHNGFHERQQVITALTQKHVVVTFVCTVGVVVISQFTKSVH